MSSTVDQSAAEDCARIKDLGYSSSRHIEMYGERFEIVSDPFPDGGGIAVHVTTAQALTERTLRLPTSILVGLKDLIPKAHWDRWGSAPRNGESKRKVDYMSSERSDQMLSLLKELSVYKAMDEDYRGGSGNPAETEAYLARARRRHEIGQEMLSLGAERKIGPPKPSAEET
jgi:hypothetical protein